MGRVLAIIEAWTYTIALYSASLSKMLPISTHWLTQKTPLFIVVFRGRWRLFFPMYCGHPYVVVVGIGEEDVTSMSHLALASGVRFDVGRPVESSWSL
jgi:hypothetical protein